jgi:hypothetical protein
MNLLPVAMLAMSLQAPDWMLSLSGGFLVVGKLNGEEPGLSSWKNHAPPGFPLDSLDSLVYHHDESYDIAFGAEAGYRGFWLGGCLEGGSGNGFVDDSADEIFGFSNYHFTDVSLGLGYDLRMTWPFTNSVGVFTQAGFLGTKANHTYTRYVETTVSSNEGLRYACAGIRARIPWACVSYCHPVSRGEIHELFVSIGGTMRGEGDSPASMYLGAYYDQSWNDRNNLSTMGCLLSVFGPGR